jgi:hypothetical protein
MNYKEKEFELGAWWFMLLRRQRSEGSVFKTSSGKHFIKPYLEKTQHTHTHHKHTHKRQDWAPRLHAYTPSYSGGRDQEDCSSKPAQANSARNSVSKKNLSQKRVVEWFKV